MSYTLLLSPWIHLVVMSLSIPFFWNSSAVFHDLDVFEECQSIILYNILQCGFVCFLMIRLRLWVLAGTPQKWCWVLLILMIRRHVTLIRLITGDLIFDHLVKVVKCLPDFLTVKICVINFCSKYSWRDILRHVKILYLIKLFYPPILASIDDSCFYQSLLQ